MSDSILVRFRAVVEAALAELEARREEVNDLNVFPVADGDTGDNMVLTLRAVVTGRDVQSPRVLTDVALVDADGRLFVELQGVETHLRPDEGG